MKECYNLNFATVSKDSFVILVMWSCSAFCPRDVRSHTVYRQMLWWLLNAEMEKFGLNRLCRSGRNIPVVVFGTEENHKISQSLLPILWPRSEPRTFVTKTHSCTFKLACSVQRAISVRFDLSILSNCAIFQKCPFRYRRPEFTIHLVTDL
jgi:hypothetical protein